MSATVNLNSASSETSAILAFPGLGIPTLNGGWKISFSGVVLQPLAHKSIPKRMLIRMLARLMKASQEDLNSEIFENRIRPFISDGDHRRRIIVDIGNCRASLRKTTRKNGQFHDLIVFDPNRLNGLDSSLDFSRKPITYQASIEDQPEICAAGSIHLLRERGLSVISDIDDTIKDSSVVDRRQLLINTFLHDFRSIDGMAVVYREWFDLGADFHYVSSSPWQLFEPLLEMSVTHCFPPGTMHLKNFRFRDQFFQKMKLKKHAKYSVIRNLIKHLPLREFVLIGDSGERDPEIYHKICRNFPDRIKGLFIRNLPLRPMGQDRLMKLTQATREANAIFGTFEKAAELQEMAERLFRRQE